MAMKAEGLALPVLEGWVQRHLIPLLREATQVEYPHIMYHVGLRQVQ